MTVPITLTVLGIPAPQGSKTRMPNGAMVDGTSKAGRAALAEWRRAISDAARNHLRETPHPPLAEPVRVTIHFRFPTVASDRYRHRHITTPDVDKCIRSTFDALVSAGLLADDRYVWSVSADKCHPLDESSPVGAVIHIVPEGAEEAALRESLKERAAEERRAARRAG